MLEVLEVVVVFVLDYLVDVYGIVWWNYYFCIVDEMLKLCKFVWIKMGKKGGWIKWVEEFILLCYYFSLCEFDCWVVIWV